LAADGKVIFISFHKEDRAWATWLAWELEEHGYTVVFQDWDFRPGDNFVLAMQKAATTADRTLMVLSPDYQQSLFGQAEWATAFATDPTGAHGKLLPVRVRECSLSGLLATMIYVDLVGLDEEAARRELRAGIERGRAKPDSRPSFPGSPRRSGSPPFPGSPAHSRPPLPPTPAPRSFRDRFRALSSWEYWPRILLACAALLALLLPALLYHRHRRAEHYRHRLSMWGLPPDVYSAQRQLDSLWLPSSVISVDWLSDQLRYLKIRRRPRAENGETRGPSIPWTDDDKVERLPLKLVGLDISDFDSVETTFTTATLAGLPASLEYLNIDNVDRLESPALLPRSLRSLSAITKGLARFSGLPPEASCLALGSLDFHSTQDLPQKLRSLSLNGTGIKKLEGLPGSLRSLELFSNSSLKTIDFLPQSLTALRVDGSFLPSLEELPANLQDLHLSRTALIKPNGPTKEFFGQLLALTLNHVDVPDWKVIPASLRSLALTAMAPPPTLPDKLWAFSYEAPPPEQEVSLPQLPRNLAVLRLSNIRVHDLGQLPRQLTGLAITHSTLRSLARCPLNVRHLDLRSTLQLEKITGLPPKLEALNLLNCRDLKELTNLPSSLRYLNIAHTDLGKLPVIPRQVEELDISGTRISSLHGLPDGLRIITLSPGFIRTLDGLPETVRELRFVDMPQDRAEASHFGCEDSLPRERWSCITPARGGESD
jgi:hypothetical protein